MKLLVAVVAWLAIACTELPEVEEDVCGNRVLDESEDCDGFAVLGTGTACGAPDTTNGCFYICDADTEVVCPDGWGCGADGRCRRAGAAYTPAPGSPWEFRAGEMTIGDVDGDGNLDLIGSDIASLQIRFGTEDGEFPSQEELVIRPPTGPPSFGRFDRDELLDVVVPTSEGLFVMLGQSDGSLEPVAYSPFAIPEGKVKMVPVESGATRLMTEVVLIADNFMEYVNSSSAETALPDGHLLTQLRGRVPVGDIGDLPHPDRDEFALAFFGESKVYIYSSEGFAEGDVWSIHPVLKQTVNLVGGAKVDLGAQFADANGDGELDLLISVTDILGKSRVMWAANSGSGSFGTPAFANVFDRGLGSPWPLAAGLFNSDKKADYVVTESIVVGDLFAPNDEAIRLPNSLSATIYITTDPWTEAVVADFNGDGADDAATVTGNLDGIDFYLNVNRSGFFNKFHVDTDSIPRNLRAADYDGDMVADLAFVEQGYGSRPDKLSVIFGATSGGPSQPISMGSMGYIEWIEPLSWVTTNEIDAIADLIVLTESFPNRDSSAIAIMKGSSSRRLIAPFVLQPAGTDQPDVPKRAFFGNFGGDDDQIRDIFAISDAAIVFDDTVSGSDGTLLPVVVESHGWVIPGTGGDGQLDASGAVSGTLPDFATFNTPCAQWVTGDLDPDGVNDRDEVIGIDASASCEGFGNSVVPRLLLARAVPGNTPPIESTTEEILGDARAPRKLRLHDLDRDGDLDLLVLFSGEVNSSDAAVGEIDGAALVVFWNQDGALSVADRSELSLSDHAPALDAVAIQYRVDTAPAILILTEGAVLLTELDQDGQYGAPSKLTGGDYGKAGRIAAGDVNADGIQDYVMTNGTKAEVWLGKVAAPLGRDAGQEGEAR